MKSKPSLSIKKSLLLFILAVLSLALLLTHLPAVQAQESVSAEQAIMQAWEKAQASGRYGFRSQLEQTTYPLPSITNAGAQPDVQHLGMEGQVDLSSEQLNLTMWQDDSFNPDTGVEIKVEDGATYARQGQGEWQEIDNVTDMFAPGGDPMAFLAGMKNVTVGERRSLEVGGITINGTQYLFDLDGPVLADRMRAMLEKQLQEQGKLPPDIRLSSSDAYNHMVGSGELWIGENGLPLHSVFNLDFAAQGDEDERVTAVITNNFFNYDLTQLGLATTSFFQSPATWLAVNVSAEKVVPTFAFGLFLASALLLIKAYWRTKTFYRFLAAFLILSMLFSPLLQSEHVSAFFEEQQERQEMVEQQRAEADYREEAQAAQENDWQPNETAAAQLKSEIPAAKPNLQPEPGTDTDNDGIADHEEMEYWESDPNNFDTDGDGLYDGLEAYTLGTAPTLFDSDGDGLSDGIEVGGFFYAAQDWYLDPLAADTNNDGLNDGVECNNWIAGIATYDPDTPCLDSDGDGIPDLFDIDNDADDVLDKMDISPFAQANQIFNSDNQFEFRLENLEVGRPVYVDFQIRPTDANHISFAGSVLDWPTGDHDGQITRYLDTTWADTANAELQLAAANAANGDVRVTPVLEMVVPYTNGHYGNLPVNDTYSGTTRPPGVPAKDWVDADLLEAYGIKAGDYGDPLLVNRDLIVYVPVAVETDPDTGMGVALKARMPYFPEQGTAGDPTVVEWGSDHSVRLLWIVQMLGDECIDDNDDPATCNRKDVLKTINIYDDDWNLTGMSVSEEHGVDTAIVYEDPTIDTDLTLDDQLWLLSWNLNGSFLRGRDADLDGVRDVRVDNLAAEIASWHDPASGPLYLEVETFIDEFEHRDELHRVMMTDTVSILNTAFAGYEDSVNPTLLYVNEISSRSMNLASMSASGNVYTADLDPTIVVEATMAGMSWKPYEYVDGQWTNADPEAYLETFEYRLSESVFVETAGMSQDEVDVVEGQRIWAQIYYSSLYQGLSNIVAMAEEVVWLTNEDIDEDIYAPTWPATAFSGVYLISSLFFLAFVDAIAATINRPPGVASTFWQNYKTAFGENYQAAFQPHSKFDSLTMHVISGILIAVAIVAIFGLALVLQGLITGDKQKIRTGGLILAACSLVANLVHGYVVLGALIVYAAAKTAQVATAALTQMANFLKASALFAVIGFVISVLIAWGIFLYQLLGPGFRSNEIAKNYAIAVAISSTILAIIFLAISLLIFLFAVPLAAVFTLILILLLIIDAILTLFGEKTLTERITEAIAETIYDIDFILADFNSEDRLDYDIKEMTLVDDEQGIIEGNAFYITVDITNTITHRKQSNVGEAKRSAFAYFIQSEEIDRHVSVYGNAMPDDWTAIGHRQLVYTTTVKNSTAISFTSAGLNRASDIYLTEAYAIPYQGCWLALGIETNDCDFEYIKGSSHINIGSEIYFDVLPSTIGGFIAVQNWTEGQINNPEDTIPVYFPTQIDQDNDGIINDELGGADPDDTDADDDDDLLSDLVEITNGTDPKNPDTDGDGLTDFQELTIWYTDPLDFDTDDDGLNDYVEVDLGWLTPTGIGDNVMRVWSNPFVADIDGDGLSDLQEFTFSQHPAVPTDPNIFSAIVDIDRLELNEADTPAFLLQFEEPASADLFLDGSGNGHRAVCVEEAANCPTSTTEGRYGYGGSFTNDDVSIDAAEFDLASDFSLGFWVKTTDINGAILTLQDDSDWQSTPGEIVVRLTSTGHPILTQNLQSGSIGFIDPSISVNDGDWHHVMYVWDAAAESGAAYIDSIDVTNYPTTYENVFHDRANDTLHIGGRSYFEDGFDGALDDVVMYDRALTTAEIADVMNGRFNLNDLIVQPDDPFTYEAAITNTLPSQDVNGYLLGESSYLTPSVAAPAVVLPFNSDAYLTNFANSVAGESSGVSCSAAIGCPGLGVSGKYGNAVQFDGDSLTIPAISRDFGEQTIAFWIRPDSYPAAGQTEMILDTESEAFGALDIMMDDSGHLLFDLGGSISRYEYNCDASGDCDDIHYDWLAAHVSDNALALNVWQHVIFTYRYVSESQGSGQPTIPSKIFLDGVLDSESWYTPIGSPPTVTIGPGTLGNSVDGDASVGNNAIHARIDELVFYNGEDVDEETDINEIMSGNYYPGFNGAPGEEYWPAYLLKFQDAGGSQVVGLVNTATGGQAAFCTGGICPTISNSGQFDEALDFDGSNDSLAMNHVLNPAEEPFTVMAWVRPDTNKGVILQQKDGSGTGRAWLGMVSDRYLYSNLGGQILLVPQTLVAGAWYHVAVTYDGNMARIYLNGRWVNQGQRTVEWSDGDMLIGTNDAFDNYFDGLVDDLAIIPAVVDEAGIRSIMNHSHPAVSIDEPFVDFHIDETVNISTNYYSAIARYDDPYYITTHADNLPVNGCSGAGCPLVLDNGAPGAQADGASVLFDGVDDRLYFDRFDFATNEYTIGFWFRTDQTAEQTIFAATDTDSPYHPGLLVETNALGQLTFLQRWPFGATGGTSLSSSSIVTDGDWHFATVTKDQVGLTATFNFFLFVDGVMEATADATGQYILDWTDVTIGRLPSTQDHYFSGEIDEMFISISAVDENAVLGLMARNMPEFEDGIVSGAGSISQYAGSGYHQFEETVEAALQLQTPIPYPIVDDNASDLRLFAPFEEVPGVNHFENLISTEADLSCSGTSCPAAGLRGKIDRALFFDGVDDALSGPNFEVDDSTMAAWVKAEGGTIFDARRSDLTAGLYLDFNGYHIVMREEIGDDEYLSKFYDIPFTLTQNEWVHVAAMFDESTGTAYVYVNGQLVGSVLTELNDEPTNTVTGSAPVIGSNRLNANPLHGYLDDVRIYDTALSQAEILNLINDSAPLLRYEFDEESDALTFEDRSVNGYTGYPTVNFQFNPTLGYTVTLLSPIPGTDGQIGNTALFDGNGRIEIPTASAIEVLTDSLAIMAWINPDTVTGTLQIAANGRENSENGISFAIEDGYLTFNNFGIHNYTSSVEILPNRWQHVAVVFDSSYNAHFYVDGSPADTIGGPSPINPNNDDPLYIGGTTAVGSSALIETFEGQIDELAVYGRELSDPEILSIYLREYRWYRERSSSVLVVDNDVPTIELLTDQPYRPVGYTQLVVKATDPTSYVALLDVGLKAPGESDFSWHGALECADASRRGVAWCPVFDTSLLGGEGVYELQFRAVDAIGHERVSDVYQLYVDDTPPVAGSSYNDSWLLADLIPGFDDAWTISLTGTVADPLVGGVAGSGVVTQSVMVSLVDDTGKILDGEAQRAAVSGTTWSIGYISGGTKPSGTYSVTVLAEDNVGNSATAVVGTILVDARPAQADVNVWQLPGGIISQTLTLSGTVSEQPYWGGVLARYHFEETAGSTTFYDSHFEQEHGDCANCPARTAALFGQGLTFDGVDDTVNLPNLFNPISDTFSISLWFYADGTGGGALVQQEDGSGQGRSLLFLNGDNTLQTNLGLGNGTFLAGTTPATPNTWHYAVFTFDGATGKLYLDGKLDKAGTLIPETADGGLNLGSNRGSSMFFPGMMDEVTFYSTVLSDYAIHALAQLDNHGVGDVNVGFELVDFAALTDTVTTTLELNPTTWYTATVANPGDRLSTWTLTDNELLENYYTIKLRSDDAVGNESGLGTIWRGLIDRVPPTVSASGQHVGGGSAAQTEYTFTFSDFLLDMENSSQPCQDASLVNLTYDDPILPHDGLPYAVTATCRVPGHEASRTFTACDSVGHCTAETVNLDPSPQLSSVAILTPTHDATITGAFLTIPVGGGAYDLDGIQEVAVQINGQPFDTISLVGETDTNWTAVSWHPTVSGTYTITAVMTDALNVTFTDSIQVYVEITGPQVYGDASCDSTRNVVDALYIMQYEVGLRTASYDCPLEANEIYLPACDVNGDMVCNVVDALFIMQCEVGTPNSLCPTIQPTEFQTQGLVGEGAAATGAAVGESAESESAIRPSSRLTTIQIESGSTAVGGTKTLPIWVTVPDNYDLTAVTLDITFDPAVVAFDDCTTNESTFALSLCALQDGDGQPPNVVSITALAVSGVNGELFLGELTFTGLQQGMTNLSLNVRTFEDGSGQSPRLQDGHLTVGRGGGNLEPDKEISVSSKISKTAAPAPQSQSSSAGKSPEAAVPSTITIGSGTTSVGQPITAPITITVPAPNLLTAATIRIEFDPTVLSFDGCAANTIPFTLNICNLSDGDGINPDVVSFSAISVLGTNGSLDLGTITFNGSSAGTSSLTIVPETLDDGSGEAPITIDGSIEVVVEPTAVSMGQMSASTTSIAHVSILLLLFCLALAATVVTLLRKKSASSNDRH